MPITPPPVQITGNLLSLVHANGSKIFDEVYGNKWHGWSNKDRSVQKVEILKDSGRLQNKPYFKLTECKLYCETLSENIDNSEDFTISIWFKMDNLNGNVDLLGSWNKKRVSGYPYNMLVFSNNGGYGYTASGYGFSSGGYCSSSVDVNKWHHSAVCRKDGKVYFFLNGNLLDVRPWDHDCISYNYLETDSDNRVSQNKSYDEIVVIKNQALWTENFDPTQISFGYRYKTIDSDIQLDPRTLLPLDFKGDLVKLY